MRLNMQACIVAEGIVTTKPYDPKAHEWHKKDCPVCQQNDNEMKKWFNHYKNRNRNVL